ncbi:MAG: NnrS family protein [Leptonema sp. (in: bacteria)]
MILNYKTQWENSLENPYRFFFPFAFLGLLLGLGVIFFPVVDNEVIYWHREILITLFLLPIANGFLYTAVPRFFNSYFAKTKEIFLSLFWLVFLFLLVIIKNKTLYSGIKFVYITQIALFVIERYTKRKSGNPLFTPFIFVSLFSGFMGSLLQWVFFYYPNPILYSIAFSLYYHAFFWILLFGVGTKFFPMLTLTVPLSEDRKYQILNKKIYSSLSFWYGFSLVLLFTFLMEALEWIALGLWIRAFLVLFLSHEAWYLYFPSQRKGMYTFFIKLYLYSIVIGHFLFPFFPSYKQHLYHIIFVGGFLGLVLIVVGRVLISHEKFDLNLEVKSKILGSAFLLIYIALWTRTTAFLITESYENHLKYASITAILGVLIYMIFFVKKLINKLNQKKFE